jgi:hypothetical protein
MASRFYLCAWEGDGSSESPYVPAVHRFHQKWRAVDGRRDPALPGGHALVEAFDVSAQAHDDMIATGEIKEITPSTVAPTFWTDVRVQAGTIAEAQEALKELCGVDNPPFKRVRRPDPEARKTEDPAPIKGRPS